MLETQSDHVLGVDPAGPGVIVVIYAHFRTKDADSCQSLPAVSVRYRWNCRSLTVHGWPPSLPGFGFVVTSRP